MSMFEWKGKQVIYTPEELEGAKQRLANYAKELGYSDRSFDIRVVLAELVHQSYLVEKRKYDAVPLPAAAPPPEISDALRDVLARIVAATNDGNPLFTTLDEDKKALAELATLGLVVVQRGDTWTAVLTLAGERAAKGGR